MERFLLALLIPLIFAITALITKLYPPQKINGVYGYRSTRSMSGAKHWYLAQKRSVLHMHFAAVVAAGAGGLFVMALPDPEWSVVIILLQTFSIPIYVYIRTERDLKALKP